MSESDRGVSQQQVQLKELEAYTRDVGRGVARIDYDAMDALDASTGDVIEIRGKRRTVAKCLPLYPSDEGRGIVRIDGREADLSSGKFVEIWRDLDWSFACYIEGSGSRAEYPQKRDWT